MASSGTIIGLGIGICIGMVAIYAIMQTQMQTL
ncbi:unnamed protein product, partial [marine sediment metagenome]